MARSTKDFGPKDLGTTVRDRFLKYVDSGKADECWPWLGSMHPLGYGRFGLSASQNTTFAHRVAIALDGRTIPAGMVTDHTCNNRGCVNPRHLQVVTQKQNIQYRVTRDNTQYRGGRPKRSTDSNYCANGHERTEENTYKYVNESGHVSRNCRVCQRERFRKTYQAYREQKKATIKETVNV